MENFVNNDVTLKSDQNSINATNSELKEDNTSSTWLNLFYSKMINAIVVGYMNGILLEEHMNSHKQ